MKCDELYQHIKDALNFFELNWNQKDEIKVQFHESLITFSHEEKTISIMDPEKPKES